MGRQTLVSLGVLSKRNETGVFPNVTGKTLRFAPPYRFTVGRDPFNINGLAILVLCFHMSASAHVSCEYAQFVTSLAAGVTLCGVHPKIVSQDDFS